MSEAKETLTIELPAGLAAALRAFAEQGGKTVEQRAAELLFDGAWAFDEHLVRRHVGADGAPPITRLANALMCAAIEAGAEEVHLIPSDEGVRVFHADCHGAGAREVGAGVIDVIPTHVQASLVDRFEKMAGTRLYTERAAREERIPVVHNGRPSDIFVRYASDERSSTGESMVLRIVRRPAPAV
jgi:type II secretory ATPase GspE/PulE/Tfp pilus assembly ATPase PilB-like protein